MALRKRKPPQTEDALVAHWEARLAAEGLAPLDTPRRKKRSNKGTATRVEPGQELYWARCDAFLWAHDWASADDRRIWELHLEGVPVRRIDPMLGQRNGTAMATIRRLEALMMATELAVAAPLYEAPDPSGRVVTTHDVEDDG